VELRIPVRRFKGGVEDPSISRCSFRPALGGRDAKSDPGVDSGIPDGSGSASLSQPLSVP